jgi:hypothetical protein
MPDVRERLANTVQRRRTVVRGWVERGVAAGELVDLPTNATASILLALADGLLLHAALDAEAFRWPNIRRALDLLLAGISLPAGRPAATESGAESVSVSQDHQR